ncbi:MAG: hypothetical protein NG712_05980 [Omnitrophica bacterium]|nr:hypothetical protein [Candidatus Omnitrophota bacterium]
MLPSRHIVASLALGAIVSSFSESLLAGLVCFFSGILVDADHIIEYIIHYGRRAFSFKVIYDACLKMVNREKNGGVARIFIFFHVGEIAILLWILALLTKNVYLLSMALGYTTHLLMDMSGRTLHPCAYFILVRAKNGFRTTDLIKRHTEA